MNQKLKALPDPWTEQVHVNMPQRVKTRMVDGRKHYIVPCVLMVAGQWTGSPGTVFYTAVELKKSAESWNGIPVCVDHPVSGGQYVSIKSTPHWATLGVLENARFENTALRADAVIDASKLKAHALLFSRIDEGETIENSLGAFFTVEERGDQKYAVNIRPDHLAILPFEAGACSVADGAGFSVNTLHIFNAPKGDALPDPGIWLDVDDLPAKQPQGDALPDPWNS